ncbi:unnamed protein product [Boreogadus saida]
MVARSRSVLQEQTVEVMEAVVWRSVAVVWRCSSGGPWRSSGGARREVRGGRLEALAAGGGKDGSRAAQGMQNEVMEAVVWRCLSGVEVMEAVVWRCSSGGPWWSSGGARCRWREGREPCSPRDAERRTEAEVLEAEASLEAKGLEAANLQGLETAEVLEATAGLEAEANLEVLESVGLEAAAAAILEADYLEVDCGDHPRGPGGGVLECPEAAAPHPAVGPVEVLEETAPAVEDGWGIRRWRIEGVTGDEDHCSGADDPPPPPHSFPEKRTDLRPTAQQTRDSLWNRFNKVDLSFRRLKGRPDVWQLGVTVQRPNAALNYTSVSYSP